MLSKSFYIISIQPWQELLMSLTARNKYGAPELKQEEYLNSLFWDSVCILNKRNTTVESQLNAHNQSH